MKVWSGRMDPSNVERKAERKKDVHTQRATSTPPCPRDEIRLMASVSGCSGTSSWANSVSWKIGFYYVSSQARMRDAFYHLKSTLTCHTKIIKGCCHKLPKVTKSKNRSANTPASPLGRNARMASVCCCSGTSSWANSTSWKSGLYYIST